MTKSNTCTSVIIDNKTKFKTMDNCIKVVNCV